MKEPLLFRPGVFYSLAGAGLVSGAIGLSPWGDYPSIGWAVGLAMALACLLGCIVTWSIPVVKQEMP